VASLHIATPGQAPLHATGFVIAPNKIMTSASAITNLTVGSGATTVSPAGAIRVTLGWDGVNAPAMTIMLHGGHVRWFTPFSSSASVHNAIGILVLPKALTPSFPLFDLMAVPTLPPRLTTIGHHHAGGANGFQRVNIGAVTNTTAPDLFRMRVFKSPPPSTPGAAGGPGPFPGTPALHIGVSTTPTTGWNVMGIINDVDPFSGAPSTAPDLEATCTWLTAPKIHWARTVT